ncbi:MAG: hypothetical protein HXO73_02165 [Scardovia wiggsiae]|nr:hypothetical protein [Scardovia wiggsiae]
MIFDIFALSHRVIVSHGRGRFAAIAARVCSNRSIPVLCHSAAACG